MLCGGVVTGIPAPENQHITIFNECSHQRCHLI